MVSVLSDPSVRYSDREDFCLLDRNKTITAVILRQPFGCSLDERIFQIN
jgi:hypothetical protein